MQIGIYDCITPFATAGSGSARWCVAVYQGQRYFLKQFLTPVLPISNTGLPESVRQKQLERCQQFERRKRALYDALHCVLGDCVVPVADFFSFERRYYAASEYIPTPYQTFDTLDRMPPRMTRQLLYSLACCLGRVHAQGIVHADLKPEHILLQTDGNQTRVRLIDFDSGFLEDDPPIAPRDIEGDPVFLAPETYLRLTGQDNPLTRKLDTFAFGAIAHRLWTGTLPRPNSAEYHYLYEAALSDTPVLLSDELPIAYRWLISKALSRLPENRPSDAMIERLLAPPTDSLQTSGENVNGLSRYMKPEHVLLPPLK